MRRRVGGPFTAGQCDENGFAARPAFASFAEAHAPKAPPVPPGAQNETRWSIAPYESRDALHARDASRHDTTHFVRFVSV
jgi:hypothetical protein